MKRSILSLIYSMLCVFVLSFSSCSSDNNIDSTNDLMNNIEERDQVPLFTNHQNLKLIKDLTQKVYAAQTKSESFDYTASSQEYIDLYNNSLDYLKIMGIDIDDLAQLSVVELDSRVIITALAISNYYEVYVYTTKASVGGCLLDALGLKALLEGGAGKIIAKKIAKQAAKKVLTKMVPYVGWGIAAYDFSDCMEWI